MKLADLRKKLRHSKRFGRPVDELDEMLMEKGTMARPDPVDVSGPMVGGRKADILIIDDPIAKPPEMLPKARPDFRREVLGEWMRTPERGDLPPTLAKLLGDDLVTWNNHEPSRIAGQVVYDRQKGDLCEVKGPSSSDTSVAVVWHGKRDPKTGQPIVRAVPLDALYVIKTASCSRCVGNRWSAGRRGEPVCSLCEGLRRVPQRGATEPFKDDRHYED